MLNTGKMDYNKILIKKINRYIRLGGMKIMERIASFTINHLELFPGLYVSRRDKRGDCVITTFDMRITAPNREPVVDMPALHTIEHMAATYLRNSSRKEDIVYFGPMGCRTGCYLVGCATLLFHMKGRYRERSRISAVIIPSRTWIWRSTI